MINKKHQIHMAIALVILIGSNTWGRQWTNKEGTKTIQADLIGIEGERVVIKRSNGRIYRCSPSLFCLSDQEFLLAKRVQLHQQSRRNNRAKTELDSIAHRFASLEGAREPVIQILNNLSTSKSNENSNQNNTTFADFKIQQDPEANLPNRVELERQAKILEDQIVALEGNAVELVELNRHRMELVIVKLQLAIIDLRLEDLSRAGENADRLLREAERISIEIDPNLFSDSDLRVYNNLQALGRLAAYEQVALLRRQIGNLTPRTRPSGQSSRCVSVPVVHFGCLTQFIESFSLRLGSCW